MDNGVKSMCCNTGVESRCISQISHHDLSLNRLTMAEAEIIVDHDLMTGLL